MQANQASSLAQAILRLGVVDCRGLHERNFRNVKKTNTTRSNNDKVKLRRSGQSTEHFLPHLDSHVRPSAIICLLLFDTVFS